MRDLPAGADLLTLARSVLIDELLPLLPADRQIDARLVAAAIAIAGREMQAGETPVAAIAAELATFYGADPLPIPPPLAGEGASRPPPPQAGEGRGGGADATDLLRRFAQDLRTGAFEGSARERAARDLMWHITLVKLRESNPRFLAANGFA